MFDCLGLVYWNRGYIVLVIGGGKKEEKMRHSLFCVNVRMPNCCVYLYFNFWRMLWLGNGLKDRHTHRS